MNGLHAAVRDWIAHDPDPVTAAELKWLLAEATDSGPEAAGAAGELADRFAGPLEFGTAGLRGALGAGPNRMNRAVVIRAAAGLAAHLTETLAQAPDPGARPPRVVIGFDARHGSARFAEDTAAVMTAAGVEAMLAPAPAPTPLLAFAVRRLGADAGVMVTASHNPAGDNGYKVYLGGRAAPPEGNGVQIVPPSDWAIAARIAAAPPADQVPRAASGWSIQSPELARDYLAAATAPYADDAAPPLPASTPAAARGELRIVQTSMHGVGSGIVLKALARAGFADVHPVLEQREPDPDFPTVPFPNPEEPGAIDLAIALAREVGADLVMAQDPDADRCAAAVPDPRQLANGGWRMLHGDEVGALLGEAAARAHAGRPGAVLANSIVSSRLLAKIAAAHGLGHARTLTGFKWIARTPGLVFGYEEAIGYCARPDLVRDKDGITAGLALADLAAREKAAGRTLLDVLDDLARAHGLHLTGQVSMRLDDPGEIRATVARLRSTPPARLAGSPVVEALDLGRGLDGLPPTDGVALSTESGARVIVRPSGTEPKVKCYLEVIRPVGSAAGREELTEARARARADLDALAAAVSGALSA
ncbi:MAG: phospho-sugar mutase [Bifidobacteriaceae bacterium]|jgi:phosphomannomutase|nr:phospho-sugar mutase [Bifidobacteriaceae bacterium]